MGDPILNCLLEVCCERLSENQVKALAEKIVEDGLCKMDEALKWSKWILTNFDLAPPESLSYLKAEIARLAREADYEP